MEDEEAQDGRRVEEGVHDKRLPRRLNGLAMTNLAEVLKRDKIKRFIYMKKVVDIIRRKPATLTLIVVVFLIATSLLKWRLRPPIDALWYLVGGGIGMYFLDVAEEFFHLSPSPFKTIIFFVLFILVSFFVTTSSGNVFASGLVFALYLCLLSSHIGEFVHRGDVSSWYRMVDTVPTKNTQHIVLGVCICLFLIQTFLFVR